MKNHLPIHLVAAVSLILASPCRADDNEAMQGTWIVESFSFLGRPYDKKDLEGMKWIYSGNEMIWKVGTVEQNLIIKLDPDKDPKWIDLALFTGAEERSLILGVYELNGDVLKVSTGLGGPGGGERSDSVEPEVGSMTQSWVLKREK